MEAMFIAYQAKTDAEIDKLQGQLQDQDLAFTAYKAQSEVCVAFSRAAPPHMNRKPSRC